MTKKRSSTRRDFLKTTAFTVLGSKFATPSWADEDKPMPQREFGRSGEKVSLLCLGGHHIGRQGEDQESIDLIREAIDLGVTFMDNAWEYHGGRSEERMGRALEDGYRDKVFLMTKHHGRDKETAMKHLEESLRRLKTDVIDLWQFHEVVYDKDPEMIFAKDGGIEAAIEAKKQGKVRYIGFTGHKDPEHFKKMLSYDYEWDAVQMPLNVLDAHFKSFRENILPILLERGIAPVGMKSLASGAIVRNNIVPVKDALRYVFRLPVATVVSGMENREYLHKNVQLAKTFESLDDEAMEKILAKTKEPAMTGDYELFKTTRRFDGPVGRELHGVG